MAEIYTYTYVRELLKKRRLSKEDLRIIHSYLYLKVNIIDKLILNKFVLYNDINILKDLKTMLELKKMLNQIEDLNILKDIFTLMSKLKAKGVTI